MVSIQVLHRVSFVHLLTHFCIHQFILLKPSRFLGNEWLLDGQVTTGEVVDLSQPVNISTKLPAAMKESNNNPCLTLGVWVFYCLEAGKACMMKAASFSQPLQINSHSGEKQVTVAIAHTF